MERKNILVVIVVFVLYMILGKPCVSAGQNKGCIVKKLSDGNYHIFFDHRLVYSTNNFDICASSGASLKRIAARQEDCVKFAKMEDKFLELERAAVCQFRSVGECISVEREMRQLSKQIKQEFIGETFDYHDVHIEMGTFCMGSAPSNSFTTEALCPGRKMNDIAYVKRV